MKVLFIAPLPPPINGQSLASETLLKRIGQTNETTVVNMTKERPRNVWDKANRFLQVASFLVQILYKQRGADLIYLTISESALGNLKDLLIYSLCFARLHRVVIHMLGGAGMKRIIEKNGLQHRVNKFFVSRVGAVVVEGPTQAATFAKLTISSRIHVVPNFAEDFLFIDEDEIRRKFLTLSPLRILFLSNLIYGKGYVELAEAYAALDARVRDNVRIVFVGGFESEGHKNDFLRRVEQYSGISYRGKFVSGQEKKALYAESHIFCLPTYYPYEGQPISILEAYATGCVVVTTYHSGIVDIFRDGVNGFVVEKQSPNSIKVIIEQLVRNRDSLLPMALSNACVARERHRTSTFAASLVSICEKCGSNSTRSS